MKMYENELRLWKTGKNPQWSAVKRQKAENRESSDKKTQTYYKWFRRAGILSTKYCSLADEKFD